MTEPSAAASSPFEGMGDITRAELFAKHGIAPSDAAFVCEHGFPRCEGCEDCASWADGWHKDHDRRSFVDTDDGGAGVPASAPRSRPALFCSRCERVTTPYVGEGEPLGYGAYADAWPCCSGCFQRYPNETGDHVNTLSLPPRVVVGANGAYWRDYGDHHSMCPTSDDNDPVEAVAVYVPFEGVPPTDYAGAAKAATIRVALELGRDSFCSDEFTGRFDDALLALEGLGS